MIIINQASSSSWSPSSPSSMSSSSSVPSSSSPSSSHLHYCYHYHNSHHHHHHHDHHRQHRHHDHHSIIIRWWWWWWWWWSQLWWWIDYDDDDVLCCIVLYYTAYNVAYVGSRVLNHRHGKEFLPLLISTVLRCRLKTAIDNKLKISVNSLGREFKTVDAEWQKALLPKSVSAPPSCSLKCWLERSCLAGVCSCIMSARYAGWRVVMALKVSMATLYLIRNVTRSQCKSARMGANDEWCLEQTTVQANEFCTRCSFCMLVADVPNNRELQ